MKKNCGSCKYWGGKDDNPRTSTGDKGPFGHASCRRIRELQDIRISQIGSEPAVVETDSSTNGTLLTQESFGCNLWERID